MKIWPLFLIALIFSACQEKEKKDAPPSKDEKKVQIEQSLFGKWNIILINPIHEEVKAEIDSIYQEQMQLLLEDSYILLQEDGRFSEQILNEHRKGEWILDDNLKQININFPTISESWKIKSIQKDTITLVANTLEKTKVTFVAVRD